MDALTISVNDACKALGLGRSKIYSLIHEQRLETIKIGSRTLIKTHSLRRLVEESG